MFVRKPPFYVHILFWLLFQVVDFSCFWWKCSQSSIWYHHLASLWNLGGKRNFFDASEFRFLLLLCSSVYSFFFFFAIFVLFRCPINFLLLTLSYAFFTQSVAKLLLFPSSGISHESYSFLFFQSRWNQNIPNERSFTGRNAVVFIYLSLKVN